MKRLTVKGVEQGLRDLSGNMAAVARLFGVSRTSVFQYIQARPELQAILKDCREAMLDNAESALYKNVLAGKTVDLIFFLKTQGRSRGYTEKSEVEVTGRGVVVVLPEKDPAPDPM